MTRPITILAGGVGGSKLVDGLARVHPPSSLTVIGNTGDDVERHGLWVSPDMDIVTYTLAGLVNPETGWGLLDDSFEALEMMRRLGEEAWFRLGDTDLGVHILRTKWRREGVRPTEIARRIARALGVEVDIIPATDDIVQTHVDTPEGRLNFQEFFVRELCRPEIRGVSYRGAESARATPEALAAIREAERIVIAPSNPIASIGPILAVPGVREALAATKAHRVAVSPLVGGRSLKGPSDRMMRAAGLASDAGGVAAFYRGLIDILVIDVEDSSRVEEIRALGMEAVVAQTVMRSTPEREALARACLEA